MGKVTKLPDVRDTIGIRAGEDVCMLIRWSTNDQQGQKQPVGIFPEVVVFSIESVGSP